MGTFLLGYGWYGGFGFWDFWEDWGLDNDFAGVLGERKCKCLVGHGLWFPNHRAIRRAQDGAPGRVGLGRTGNGKGKYKSRSFDCGVRKCANSFAQDDTS